MEQSQRLYADHDIKQRSIREIPRWKTLVGEWKTKQTPVARSLFDDFYGGR